LAAPALRLPDGKPAIIAHRGDSSRAPENTLAAIELAISAGADMVEIDVGFSADGALMVIHDASLERTTSGTGEVRALPLAGLRELDAGGWFAPRFAGEKIPLLGEALDLVRGRLPLNVEIKGDSVVERTREGSPGDIEDAVLAAVRERGMFDQVLFSSFHPLALWRLRRRDPRAFTASLLHAHWHRGRSPREIVEEVGSSALHVADRELEPQLILGCREAGIPLRVYTVNDPGRYLELAAQGIDAVFSDDPGGLRRAAESLSKRRGGHRGSVV
jgi:glycerophosphoryl diester phosphodiesterase